VRSSCMPNLDIEREHLRKADEHIATAVQSISVLEQTLASDTREGRSEGRKALDAVRDGLVAFHAHRALIVATIADIEAGRLPDES
jgi:hypothetical protein